MTMFHTTRDRTEDSFASVDGLPALAAWCSSPPPTSLVGSLRATRSTPPALAPPRGLASTIRARLHPTVGEVFAVFLAVAFLAERYAVAYLEAKGRGVCPPMDMMGVKQLPLISTPLARMGISLVNSDAPFADRCCKPFTLSPSNATFPSWALGPGFVAARTGARTELGARVVACEGPSAKEAVLFRGRATPRPAGFRAVLCPRPVGPDLKLRPTDLACFAYPLSAGTDYQDSPTCQRASGLRAGERVKRHAADGANVGVMSPGCCHAA